MKTKKILPILLSACSFLPISNAKEKTDSKGYSSSALLVASLGSFAVGGAVAGIPLYDKLKDERRKVAQRDFEISITGDEITALKNELAAEKEKNKKMFKAFFGAEAFENDDGFNLALKEAKRAVKFYERWKIVKDEIMPKMAEQAKQYLKALPLSAYHGNLGALTYQALGDDDCNKLSFYSRCCTHILNYLMSEGNDNALSNPDNYKAENSQKPDAVFWTKGPDYTFK